MSGGPHAPRWALSLDGAVHLQGELTARCGAPLPTSAHRHDQPPPGPPCEPCRVIFLADRALLSRIIIHEAARR